MSSMEEYRAAFDERVFDVLRPAAHTVPALGTRLAEAGLQPDDLVDVAALDRLPVQSKDDLIDLQAKDPPFGGYLAPGTKIRRIFQSPGPLYEPEPIVDDHWRGATALEAAGFGSSDIVLNCFGYHLSPAGASALPSVADLADSSALAAAVLGVAREGRITDPQTYMVLSLEILPDGSVGRLRAIDWFMPAALNYTLEVAVREQLRQSSVGAGNVRLRVEPTTGVVRVGRSEQCPPVETMRFELYAPATMGRLNLQPAVLRLRVLADGAVAGVTVMRSTGDGEIDRWIVSKVPERRYHPALIDGIAVPMDYEQTVRVRQR